MMVGSDAFEQVEDLKLEEVPEEEIKGEKESLEAQALWLISLVCHTAPYGEAYEIFCDSRILSLCKEVRGLEWN